MSNKVIIPVFLLIIFSLITFVSAHQYIAEERYGSIRLNDGSIEEGVAADMVDFASTLFSNFINGTSARYTIQNASYNGDISVMVAEFQNDISFSELEVNYVNLLTQGGGYDIDYDPTSVGDSLEDAQILIVGAYGGRDGLTLQSSYIWISQNKIIIISFQDFRSIEGIPEKEFDFNKFLTSYIRKHPSTLVKDVSCVDKGYKCTSAIRGCGLNYKQKDYSCDAGSAIICCEDVSFCGDNICDTGIEYPYSEDENNCPEDCAIGIEETHSIEEGDINLPENEEINNIAYVCRGCEKDGKCYPFNYREDGEYCNVGQEFIFQLEEGDVCDNNFECFSNLCINNQCLSSGAWQKFLRWLNRIFG